MIWSHEERIINYGLEVKKRMIGVVCFSEKLV